MNKFTETTQIEVPRSLLMGTFLMERGFFLSTDPEYSVEFFDFASQNHDFLSFGFGGYSRTISTLNIYYSCRSFAYQFSPRFRDEEVHVPREKNVVARWFEKLEKLIAEPPHKDFKVCIGMMVSPGTCEPTDMLLKQRSL